VRPQGDERLLGGFTSGTNVNPVVGDQVAGLLLSFGGDRIDLASANDGFYLEVSGAGSAWEFGFASGTRLDDIAAAINTFTPNTSVIATVSGTGIRLATIETGFGEYVSVKIIDDGGIGAANKTGIYRLNQSDPSGADAADHDDFDNTAAANGISDIGRDAKTPLGGDADAAARDVRELLLGEVGRASALPSRTQSEHALQLLG